MKTKIYALFAALFATPVISQILIQASPPWDYYNGTGPEGSTQAPASTHVSQIDFYDGPSAAYMAVQVYHGTLQTAATKVPYSYATGTCLPLGTKETLTLNATQRITQVIIHSRYNGNTLRRFLYGFDFTLNDGSTPSFAAATSPYLPEHFTFVTPTDKEFAGFFLQDATGNCEITDLAVWYNPRITIDVSAINGLSKQVFTDSASTSTFTATDNLNSPAETIEYSLTYQPSSATTNLISLVSSTPPSVDSLTKITISTTLTWAEANTLVGNLGGRLPTQQEFQNHAVVIQLGETSAWMPASRSDGIQGDFVWIGNYYCPIYTSHTDSYGISPWGSTNDPSQLRPMYLYAHFSTSTTVNFAASSDATDAQAYIITIQARFFGETVWHTNSSFNYTYVNPCLFATITVTAYPSIASSVLAFSFASTAYWFDSVSGSTSLQICGGFTTTRTFQTNPATFIEATMGSIFQQLELLGQSFLLVQPTEDSQIGTYTVRYVVCLTSYPTRCSSNLDTSVTIAACIVTSVQVVESSANANLSAQQYLLSDPAFNYALTTKQTPACGYSSSGWAVTATSTDNPGHANVHALIDATSGVYGVVHWSDRDRVGTFTIVVNTVVVNGVTYGSSGISLVSPSSFVLTVTDGCSTTAVTATTVSIIFLTVFDASSQYPTSGVAYADFTDTRSTALSDSNYCPKTYSATITGPSTLTTFNLDTNARKFQIYSNAFSQVGNYTVTLKGAVTAHPAQYATTTFNVTVQNPCLTTTLLKTTSPSDMTTSIMVATGAVTQQFGIVKDQVSISHGDATGTQYCGSRQYSISSVISSGATVGLGGSQFYITSSTRSIYLTSTNPAQVGTHTVTVISSLSSFTSVKLNLTSFTVTIQPCVVTSVQIVQSSDYGALTTQSYTLSSIDSLKYLLAVKQTPSCEYVISGLQVTATGPEPANFQSVVDASLQQFQNNDFESDFTVTQEVFTPTGWSATAGSSRFAKSLTYYQLSNDACASGRYCVGIKLIGSYLQQSLSVPSGQSVTVTFYLTTRRDYNSNPTGCTVSYGSIILGTYFSNLNWVQHTVTIPATSNNRIENFRFTNTQHICNGDCGLFIDRVQIVSTSFYKVVTTTATSQAGTYIIQTQVSVGGSVYDTSTLSKPSSFQLTVVNPCQSTTVTSTPASDITLTVWDLSASYPASGVAFADFTDSVSTLNSDPNMCAKTYTATVSTNFGGNSLTNFQFDTIQRKFTVSSQNYNQIGTFTVSVNGKITDFPSQFATQIFTITVIDPCLTTTLIPPTLALIAMETSVLVQISPGGNPYYATQQVGIFQDQVSVDHGDQTGKQYCFARKYLIGSVTTSSPFTTAELVINQYTGLIEVYTARNAAIGIHIVTVSVYLENYPTITSTLTEFTIEIIGCVITGFTMVNLSPANDQTYTISDSLFSWSLSGSTPTQVPPCGYSQTLNSGPTPTFVTTSIGSTITYSALTRNLSLVGENTITVTSTLIGYNFSPARTAPTSSSTFKLNSQDPCLLSTISMSPTQVDNFVVFAGYQQSTLIKYTIQDSVSLFRTLNTDSIDFCGEKLLNFQINGNETLFITLTNEDFINLSPPSEMKNFGVSEATVVASMLGYATIKSVPISFSVTILGSVVPKIENQSYVLGTNSLTISYGGFEVVPAGYDAGFSKVEAFIFTDSILPEIIDLSCECLININQVDWFQNDETQQTFIIGTNSERNVGEYTIVLVQQFDSYIDVHPFTAFNLSIIAVSEKYTVQQVPYFEPPLVLQKITQCSNSNMWSLDLPQVLDPNNLTTAITAQLHDYLFSFDVSLKQIKQIKLIDTSTNTTIAFKLTNSVGVAATYYLRIEFECPVDTSTSIQKADSQYTQPTAKIQQQKVKVLQPAKIVSISRVGIVEIKFYLPIQMPNFTTQANQTNNESQRQLSQTDFASLAPQNYITADVLSVQLQSKYSVKNINWQCTGFNNQSIQLQLNFTDPMEISQDNQDTLLVKFLNSDLFTLSARAEYLFGNESLKILTFDIPTQLLDSNTITVAQFETMGEKIEQVGLTVIITTLAIQFVAKKAIASMWLYACALQVIILIVLHSSIFIPSSVDVVLSSVNGILTLSALDKNKITAFLRLDVITNSKFYQSLDGVAIAGIGILIFILIIGLSILISRKCPKVQQVFMKIQNLIFWNFLIRYFQVSFIGMNYGALLIISQSGGLSNIASSVVILILQYSITGVIAYFLLRIDLQSLTTVDVKMRFGNIYQNLDTRQRHKILFGLIFFIQRALLVPTVTFKYNFGNQWQLFQTILLLNTAYLLTAQPYQDSNQANIDKINCFFLMFLCALTTTYSSWNPNSQDRFFYGIIFDFFVCLQFLVNIVFVIRQIITPLTLKIKQLLYRLKLRMRRRAIIKQKAFVEGARQKEIALREENIQKFQELRTIHAHFIANSISLQHKLPQVVMYLKEKHPARVKYEKEKLLKMQNELSEISEISEYSESSESGESSSYEEEDYQPTKRWRPPTPRPLSSRFKQNQTSVTLLDDLVNGENEQQQLEVQRRPYIPDDEQPPVNLKDAEIDDEIFEERKLTYHEQSLLNFEIGEYFSRKNDNIDVRKYDINKIFTWRDIWPYHSQACQDYKGPVITKQEHWKHVRKHLHKEWIKSYPQMPRYPLQLALEKYKEICEELRPRIVQQFGVGL